MSVTFSFDGRPVRAAAGQSVAGALLAAGHTVLTRSPKYRRPRGVYCAGGHCPNCLLRVDGTPHVRACLVPAADGMRVETEGAAGRRFDPFRALNLVGTLFPVGFQYRWFKRQNLAWRLWEGRLRALAAETEIPPAFDVPPAERMGADLLVVGAGPAGVAAAASAARAGLRVVLVGRRAVPAAPAGVTVLAPATVVAGFGERYVVDAGDRAVEVTAPASVLATGAYQRAVAFPGNDRPGVMLAAALRRLAMAERVLTGATAVLVTEDDSAYHQAGDLDRAGVTVRAIVDARPPGRRPPVPPGVEVLAPARVVRVRGRRRVTAAVVESGGVWRAIGCHVIGMSGGWQPADELRYVATSTGDDVVHGERARRVDPGEGPMPVLHGVGAVVGTMDRVAAVAEGTAAGEWAAATLAGNGAGRG